MDSEHCTIGIPHLLRLLLRLSKIRGFNAYRLPGLPHHTNNIDIVVILGVADCMLDRQVSEEAEDGVPVFLLCCKRSQIRIVKHVVPDLSRPVPRKAPKAGGDQIESLVWNARVDMYASPLALLVWKDPKSSSVGHLRRSLRRPVDRHSHSCVPP